MTPLAYIKMGVFIFLLTGAIGAYAYVKKIEADNAQLKNNVVVLEENNNKLNVAIEQQQEVLEQVKQDQQNIAKAYDRVVALNAKLQGDLDVLKSKFRKVKSSGTVRDIGVLAQSKPELVGKILTNASLDAMRCVEIVSGDSLTDGEKNATKKSQINAQCADIANPNFIEHGVQ